MGRRWGVMSAMLALACSADGGATSGASSSATSGAGTTAGLTTAAASETATPPVTDAGTADSTTTSTPSDSDSTTTGRPSGPIGVLTVTLATASADEEAVDATPLQLCLTADDCFALGRSARVGDGRREAGPLQFEVDAYDDVALDIQSVDRFELRAATGADFAAQCLSVSFDGVPALCTKNFAGPLGSSASFDADAPSDCTSCFARDADTDLMVTHGPFVGARDAESGRAHIWLRTDASRPVQLHISTNADMTDARLAASVTPAASDDFTTELIVDGLAAGGTYYYQITVDGTIHATVGDDAWHPGGVYRLRMPPPEGEAGQFTFALSSCARMFKHGNYDAVRDNDPAFWLNVGDYHYGNVLRTHFTERDGSRDLRRARDEMRWWYRTAHWEKSTLFARVPLLNTWDDHDYGGDTEEAHGEMIGKEASRATFLEYMANGDREAARTDDAVYFKATYGDVDVFVLDPRYHRPALVDNGQGQLVAPDPTADPLGEAQSDWLIAGLVESSATFKFIAAGTRFYGGSNKAWLPFLIARDALLARIVDEGVTGVVFLAGGPHASEYRQFDAAGRTWHELGASPITSGLSDAACSGASTQVACYNAIKNFLLLDVDTARADPTITARVMTFDGQQPWSAEQQTIVIPRSNLN